MFKLTTKQEIDTKTQDQPGVYKIYWIKKNIAQPINRMIGTDNSGLLYIGQTKGSITIRLNQFRCSAFLKSTNHSGGLKYRTLNVVNQLIKADELLVKVEYCKDSLKKEKTELRNYASKFGEVPPLNG